MNLWIRSQDKQLLIPINDILKVSEGSLIQTSTRPYMTERHYNIMYKNIHLGEYKSKKRTLEVLDEIENKFLLDIENSNYKCADLIIKAYMLPKIYEMPKE